MHLRTRCVSRHDIFPFAILGNRKHFEGILLAAPPESRVEESTLELGRWYNKDELKLFRTPGRFFLMVRVNPHLALLPSGSEAYTYMAVRKLSPLENQVGTYLIQNVVSSLRKIVPWQIGSHNVLYVHIVAKNGLFPGDLHLRLARL